MEPLSFLPTSANNVVFNCMSYCWRNGALACRLALERVSANRHNPPCQSSPPPRSCSPSLPFFLLHQSPSFSVRYLCFPLSCLLSGSPTRGTGKLWNQTNQNRESESFSIFGFYWTCWTNFEILWGRHAKLLNVVQYILSQKTSTSQEKWPPQSFQKWLLLRQISWWLRGTNAEWELRTKRAMHAVISC